MIFDKPVICPVSIGRVSELAALQAFVDITGKGQGRVGLVHGEAGIGKSRLIAETKKTALANGFLTLQGDCFQADAIFPYVPIVDLLRVLLTSRHPAALPADQAPFVNELVRLFPDLELLTPQPVSSPSTQKLDPEQQKRRLFSLLTQLFALQTTRQPVLLIVEDLHWCDPSSLELLLHLVHHTASQPLCFLFTYRTEEISPVLSHWLAQLDRQRLFLELGLERLSQAEVGAMLQAIFASTQPVPARLLDAIYIQTEGNPFFV